MKWQNVQNVEWIFKYMSSICGRKLLEKCSVEGLHNWKKML